MIGVGKNEDLQMFCLKLNKHNYVIVIKLKLWVAVVTKGLKYCC